MEVVVLEAKREHESSIGRNGTPTERPLGLATMGRLVRGVALRGGFATRLHHECNISNPTGRTEEVKEPLEI